MQIYAYIVALSWKHPKDGTTTEHTVPVDAYSITDANMQAIIETSAPHAYLEQGYKPTTLSIKPDFEKARKQIESMMKDIGLMKMPTLGGNQ